MAIHTEFQPRNPFRSPAWRADYVNKLLSHQPHPRRPSRLYDDEWVKKAWQFLRRWYRDGTTDEDQEDKINNLWPTNPGLFYACMFYGNEDGEWRTMLEARLLARMSDERIAEKLGTYPDTVYWYEKIYFNVRDRIDNWDYIHKVISGRASERARDREGSITVFQRALMLKTYAYFGGEHLLNLVLTGFASNMTAPKRAQDVQQWAEQMFNAGLVRQGLIATTLLDTNKFNIVSVLQLTQVMVQQEQHIRMFGSASLEIDRNIEKAGQLIQVQMAGGHEHLDAPEGTKKPRRRVSTLRSAEQLQLAAGKQPATDYEQDEIELRERMKNAKPNREVQQRG